MHAESLATAVEIGHYFTWRGITETETCRRSMNERVSINVNDSRRLYCIAEKGKTFNNANLISTKAST